MTASSQRLIEARAFDLLQQFKMTEPPVDVQLVASRLGIRVERADLDDDCSGVLVRNKTHAVIGVNWMHHVNRQRFTIAHEIGHFVLHERNTYIDKEIYAQYRNHESATGTLKEERQANQFAAALLMPEEWVREWFGTKLIEPGDDQELCDLARAFGVSVTAMSFRLANLGLLKL